MEAFAVVATVASIVQLSQAALTLSKTLYDISSTIASAKEDITNLADDLKTFSQSLTLLSRLLEDSKAWYSDDVYLLTVKIIRDCVDLYGKIDKVLIKLGGNGKSGWKFRVKFVYKESQIKKLMERLRDMKGNLATILMTLQVDLQLSLLNISSASKIQRAPEESLRSETIQTLQDAQKSIETAGFLPRYTTKAEQTIRCVEREVGMKTGLPTMAIESTPHMNIARIITEPTQMIRSLDFQPETIGLWTESSQMEPEIMTPISEPNPTTTNHEFNNSRESFITAQSLRSSSSTESFKSFTTAISMQSESETIEQQLKSIKSVVHAFNVALQTLQSLVSKRIRQNDLDLYGAVRQLEVLLLDGGRYIEQRNGYYCERYGFRYVQAFSDSDKTALEDVSATILKEIVTSLHIHSAPHQNLSKEAFEDLHTQSKQSIQKALEILTGASNTAATESLNSNTSFSANKEALPGMTFDFQQNTNSNPEKGWIDEMQATGGGYWYTFGSFGGRRNVYPAMDDPIVPLENHSREEVIERKRRILSVLQVARERRAAFLKESGGSIPSVGNMVLNGNLMNNYPELTLPFVGYTFKRFEQVNSLDDRQNMDNLLSRLRVSRSNRPNDRKIPAEGVKTARHQALATALLERLRNGQVSGDEKAEISGDIEKDTVNSSDTHRNVREICVLTRGPIASLSVKTTLWQTSLITLRSSSPETYISLKITLTRVFGFEILESEAYSRTRFCRNLATVIKNDNQNKSLVLEVLETRHKIINIVSTVSEQLGLKLGSLAWCCVHVLLRTTSSSVKSNDSVTENESKNTLLHDLLEITAIIARYNVMENLYNNTCAGLEIDDTYQTQMVELCIEIFKYFGSAFALAQGGDIPTEEQTKYEDLLMSIRKLDQKARGFKILISIDKRAAGERVSESEDESDQVSEVEAEPEDDDGNGDGNGDDDWEQIDGIVSRTNSELLQDADVRK